MKRNSEKLLQFEEYYINYFPQVLRFVQKKVTNVQVAEDIAMDSFVSCWEKFDAFDPSKASFQTWLYVVVNNKLKNYFRDKKDYVELDDFLVDNENFQDDFAEAAHLTFLREHLAVALEELSELQRKIVIYKYFQNKKSTDIAELTGMSPGNVRIQLKRAIDKLRVYFSKNNIR